MTEFGNLALVEERDEQEGGKVAIRLPGVRSGDMAARVFKPEVRVCSLQFSPTGNYIRTHTHAHCLYTTLRISVGTDHNQALSTKCYCGISQVLQNTCYSKIVVSGSISCRQLVLSVTVMCSRYLDILGH
jgi:hypothetical protein